MSDFEVGTCSLCKQVLIRTADDCWHPHDVAVCCPSEPSDPVERLAWGNAGNRTLRPGREHFVARPAPVITPGATPFTICICAACGPPWRATLPEPAPDATWQEKMLWRSYMALCPTCGNKRCPAAMDHARECSGSNSPDQPHLTGRL